MFELDPAMCSPELASAYSRAAKPLRLVPCAGGVRLSRAGKTGEVHSTPGGLATELWQLAFMISLTKLDTLRASRGSATHNYWLDCWSFLLEAGYQVIRHPDILALWGREPNA